MSELLSQAGEQTAAPGLWDNAPAWRNLIIAATLLTAVAAALPVLLPPQMNAIVTAPARIVSPPVVRALSAPARQLAVPVLAPPSEQKPRVRAAALAPARQNQAQPAQQVQPAPQQIQPVQQTQPAQPANVCTLRPMSPTPQLIGLGTVIGFEDHALSLARIQVTEAQAGGKIDPAYIDNQRIIVQRPSGQTSVFILPKGMTVQIGDRVTLQNGYRNMALPCNYIPVEIATDIGPAPAQTSPPTTTAAPQN
jgi:hypothetical protein